VVTRFDCPYLGGFVELTDEREGHIAAQHPDLLPRYRDRLVETLADPDQVRVSDRSTSARLFSRWFASVLGGKHVVVVVVSDPGSGGRHWVVTAYLTGKLTGGVIEWTRT
jgi:hypothetical protein